MDFTGFQRFPQDLEYFAVKLSELIQKQHTVVRQRDFPWAGIGATCNFHK